MKKEMEVVNVKLVEGKVADGFSRMSAVSVSRREIYNVKLLASKYCLPQALGLMCQVPGR